METTEKFRHIPSGTLVAADKWNSDKTVFKTKAGAKFAIADCEKWEPNYPQLAIAMPPEIGHVVASGDHVFVVVYRTKAKDEIRLWYEWNPETKIGKYYPMDQCQLIEYDVEKRLIDGWIHAIAAHRSQKETSAEYQTFIKLVPEPIRDICVIKSMDYKYEPIEIPEDNKGFF
jgi:hypothetical protein